MPQIEATASKAAPTGGTLPMKREIKADGVTHAKVERLFLAYQ
jgi:hypothetical protein